MSRNTTPARCDHRDSVGQRCLRPAGHPATMEGWFTDGSANAGHDYGGVASDARTSAEWALHQPAASGHDSRRKPAGPLDIDSILAATVALAAVAKATDLDTRVAAWLEQQRRLHDEQGGIIRDAVARDGYSAHDMHEMIGMLHDIMETLLDETGNEGGPA